MASSLNVQAIVSMPFAENTYVVWLPERRDALVIDPGFEPDQILQLLEREQLRPAAILNTHGHADHIAGNETLKAQFPDALLIIGASDETMLTDSFANLSAPFGVPIVSPRADRVVREGDVLEEAGIRLEVLDIPGHSPGHVVFVWRGEPCVVFGGDVLFQGGIGRDDFPGGDGALLRRGIRSKLFKLPDDTIVCPGHGPHTTVGEERKTNPFVSDEGV